MQRLLAYLVESSLVLKLLIDSIKLEYVESHEIHD